MSERREKFLELIRAKEPEIDPEIEALYKEDEPEIEEEPAHSEKDFIFKMLSRGFRQ